LAVQVVKIKAEWMKISATDNKGFTLVELAVILVIIGMLITMGASMVGPLMKTAKYNETKETLNGALASVSGFGTINNRVPTATEFPSAVRMPKDSWGSSLVYIPDASLITTTAGGICGRKSTALSVVICPDGACAAPTATVTDVAFVALSAGENKNRQTANAAGVVKVYATDIPAVDDYATDMNRPEQFDDVVKWLTLNELRINSGCVGAQLKILNNEMPYGTIATAYSAIAYAAGGAPYAAGGNYRWCVQSSLPAGVSIVPNTVSANCSALAEGSWGQANTLVFSGTPTASGSFSITVFARDNNDAAAANDNIAQRSLVITINP